MEIFLYKDSMIDLSLESIAEKLSAITRDLSFTLGQCTFTVPRIPLNKRTIDEDLPNDLIQEVQGVDLAICATGMPYDNNYFFESFSKLAVVSFHDWEHLTDLPLNNGIVFFIAAILGRKLPFGPSHESTTGCINDFWWNKSDVDGAMRSAFICHKCKQQYDRNHTVEIEDRMIEDIDRILNELSFASRARLDIVSFWEHQEENDEFDVFLCHNSDDKPEIRLIHEHLKMNHQLNPWFDEEQLRPGLPWQEVLEQQISTIGAAAVFVGQSRIGPWQNRELRAFLEEFVRRNCPVIPVILPDAQEIPNLPIFLRQMTWVDLRWNYEQGMRRLVWGITGRRPRDQ